MDEATAAQVRELLTKGAAGGSLFLTTDDAQATFETLRDRGVDITDEPSPKPVRHRLRHPRPVRQRHPHRPDVRRNDADDRRVRSLDVGIAFSGAVTIFLLFDAVIHLANVEVVRTSMAELGYRDDVAPILGVIELCCIGLYLWRRTELLGAVVLTGYLGGAIAANLRIDKPLISTDPVPRVRRAPPHGSASIYGTATYERW